MPVRDEVRHDMHGAAERQHEQKMKRYDFYHLRLAVLVRERESNPYDDQREHHTASGDEIHPRLRLDGNRLEHTNQHDDLKNESATEMASRTPRSRVDDVALM
mgnify:CR=1 FL=1